MCGYSHRMTALWIRTAAVLAAPSARRFVFRIAALTGGALLCIGAIVGAALGLITTLLVSVLTDSSQAGLLTFVGALAVTSGLAGVLLVRWGARWFRRQPISH